MMRHGLYVMIYPLWKGPTWLPEGCFSAGKIILPSRCSEEELALDVDRGKSTSVSETGPDLGPGDLGRSSHALTDKVLE